MTISTNKTDRGIFSSFCQMQEFSTTSQETANTALKTQSLSQKIISPEYKALFDKTTNGQTAPSSSAKRFSNYHQRLFDALKSGEFSLLPTILKEEKKLPRNPGISYCCEEAFDFLVAHSDAFHPAIDLQLKNYLLMCMCSPAFDNRIKHLNNTKGAFDPAIWQLEASLAFSTNPEQIEPFLPYEEPINNRGFYLRTYDWCNGNLNLSWFNKQGQGPGYDNNSAFNAWKDEAIRNLNYMKGAREFYHRLDLERRIGLSCEKDSNKDSVAIKKQICFLMQIFNRYFLRHSKCLDIGQTIPSKQTRTGLSSKVDKKDITKHLGTLLCLEKLINLLLQKLQQINNPGIPDTTEKLDVHPINLLLQKLLQTKNPRILTAENFKTEFANISIRLKNHDPIAAALILDGKIHPDAATEGGDFLRLPFINVFEPLSKQVCTEQSSGRSNGAYTEQYMGFSLTALLIGAVFAPFTGGASLAIGGAAFIGGTTASAINQADPAPKGEGLSSFFSGAVLAATLASSGAAAASAKATQSNQAAFASVKASNPNFNPTKPTEPLPQTKPSNNTSQSSAKQESKPNTDKKTETKPKTQEPPPGTSSSKNLQTVDSSQAVKQLIAEQKNPTPQTQLQTISEFILKDTPPTNPLREMLKPKEPATLISSSSFKISKQDQSDLFLFELKPEGTRPPVTVSMNSSQGAHQVSVNNYLSSSSHDKRSTLHPDLLVTIKKNKNKKNIDFCIEKNGKCETVKLPPSMNQNMTHLFEETATHNWDCFDFVQACAGDFSYALEEKKSPKVFSDSRWNELKPLSSDKLPGDALEMMGAPNTGTHHCAIYLGENLYLSKIGKGNTALLITNEEELKQLYPDCTHSFKWFRVKQPNATNIDSSLYLQTHKDPKDMNSDHPSLLEKGVKKIIISQLPKGAQRIDTIIDIAQAYQTHSPEKATTIIAGGAAGAAIGKEVGGIVSSGVCKIPIFRVYEPIITPGFKFLGKCIGGYVGAEMGDSIGEAVEAVTEKVKIKPVTFPPLGFPH